MGWLDAIVNAGVNSIAGNVANKTSGQHAYESARNAGASTGRARQAAQRSLSGQLNPYGNYSGFEAQRLISNPGARQTATNDQIDTALGILQSRGVQDSNPQEYKDFEGWANDKKAKNEEERLYKGRNKNPFHHGLDETLGKEGLGGLANELIGYSPVGIAADTFMPEFAFNPETQESAAEKTYGGGGPLEFDGGSAMPTGEQMQVLQGDDLARWQHDAGDLAEKDIMALTMFNPGGQEIAAAGKVGGPTLKEMGQGFADVAKEVAGSQAEKQAARKSGKDLGLSFDPYNYPPVHLDKDEYGFLIHPLGKYGTGPQLESRAEITPEILEYWKNFPGGHYGKESLNSIEGILNAENKYRELNSHFTPEEWASMRMSPERSSKVHRDEWLRNTDQGRKYLDKIGQAKRDEQTRIQQQAFTEAQLKRQAEKEAEEAPHKWRMEQLNKDIAETQKNLASGNRMTRSKFMDMVRRIFGEPTSGLAKKNKGSSKAQRRAYAEATAGEKTAEPAAEAAAKETANTSAFERAIANLPEEDRQMYSDPDFVDYFAKQGDAYLKDFNRKYVTGERPFRDTRNLDLPFDPGTRFVNPLRSDERLADIGEIYMTKPETLGRGREYIPNPTFRSMMDDVARSERSRTREAAQKAAQATEPAAAVGKFEQAAENASIPRNLNRALLRDSKNRLELNPVENSFDVIPREFVDVSEADAKILKEAFGEKQADRILNGLGENATKPRDLNLSEMNMRAIDKNQRNVDERLEKALKDSMKEGKKILKKEDAKKIGPKKALASGLLGLGLFSTATNKQVVDTFGNAANNVNDFLNSIAGVDAEGNYITEDSEQNPADNQDNGGGIAHLMIDPYTGQPVWGLSREDWNKKEQRDQYAQALTDENFRNWISGFNPQYADDANGYEYFRDLDLGDKEEMLYNMLGYNGGQYELPGWRDMYSTAIFNATNGKERLTGDAEHDMPLIMDWIEDSAIDAGLAVDPTEKGRAYLPTVNLGLGYGSARNMSDYLIQKDAGDFYEGIRQATGNDYPYDNADLGTALFYENMKNNADKTDFSKYGQDNLDQLAALLNMGGDTAQFEFYEPAEGEEDSWRPNADYSYYNLANAAGTLKPEELAQFLPVYDDLKYVSNAIPADAADTILSDYSKWTGQHIRRKNSGKKNE